MAQAQPKPRLAKAKRQTLDTAVSYLFYGPEGVGKSSLAADRGNPIVIDVENGTKRLDVARYPFRDGPLGHVPESFAEVMGALKEIRDEPHDYDSIVIDTVSALEPLVWDVVVKRYSGVKGDVNKSGKQLDSIVDLGYGNGYKAAVDVWRQLAHMLDQLIHRRNMDVILIGHATVKGYNNPLGDDFDRILLRADQRAADFLREWSDVVGFVSLEQWAKTEEGDFGKTIKKGVDTGRVVAHFRKSAVYDAKSRIPLPDEILLPRVHPWAPIAAAIDQGQHATSEALRELIAAELKRLNDETTTTKATEAMEGAGDDTATLSRYLHALKMRDPKPKEND